MLDSSILDSATQQNYFANVGGCGQGLANGWGNSSLTDQWAAEYNAALGYCVSSFCQNLTYDPGAIGGINETTGIWGCQKANGQGTRPPTNCAEGDQYMESLKNLQGCFIYIAQTNSDAMAKASAAPVTTISDTMTNANTNFSSFLSAESKRSCDAARRCELATYTSITANNNEWGVSFCGNFFEALADQTNNYYNAYDKSRGMDFGWVQQCGYTGSYTDKSSGVYSKCSELVRGAPAGKPSSPKSKPGSDLSAGVTLSTSLATTIPVALMTSVLAAKVAFN
jgi:hypothetical protein